MLCENFLVNYKVLGVLKNIRCHCKRFEMFTKEKKGKDQQGAFQHYYSLHTNIFTFVVQTHYWISRHFTYMVRQE